MSGPGKRPSKGDLPRVLSQKKAIALLTAHGWTRSQGGKHVVKMEKSGHRPITLPIHKGADYGPKLTNGILRAAGLKGQAEADQEES